MKRTAIIIRRQVFTLTDIPGNFTIKLAKKAIGEVCVLSGKDAYRLSQVNTAGYKRMRDGLMAHEIYPQFPEQITDFLVRSFFKTGRMVKDQDGRIQPRAMLHGDLHSASIQCSRRHIIVSDPESSFFGPAGYDLGSILADLFFAWAGGNATITGREDRLNFCGWCMCAIMEIVDLFRQKFLALYDEKNSPFLSDYTDSRDQCLSVIFLDAASRAGVECLRQTTEPPLHEAITSIEDPEAKARAESILLAFGQELILNREDMNTAGDYYNAMENAIRNVEPNNDILGPEKTILDYDTVNLDDYNHSLVIIDQTKLPSRIEILSLTDQSDIWDAIYELKVRGAPAIGVAAAIGIYLAAREIKTDNYEEYLAAFRKASDYLNSSRPTAVNLSWALKRMEQIVLDNKDLTTGQITELLHDEALAIRDEDIEVCRSIGKYGLSLVKPGDGLLTHCNAGQLATVKYGTATAPMYLGHEQGYNFKIYCDETRPLLQGARLTSFELSSAGMDVTVLCDNMSASLMREGRVNAVFVGCDRVAANGDAANKIGTSMVALAAKRYGIPFYVCAPTSTIDCSLSTGEEIIIEQRKGKEVTDMWYKHPMAPEAVNVYNPAFDVTDADLITGIVTEYGIAYPPYEESIKDIFLRKEIRHTVEGIVKDMESE